MAFKKCCGGGGTLNITGADDIEIQILCDVNGAVSTPFIRFYSVDIDTNVVTVIDELDMNGSNYTTTGTIGVCDGTNYEIYTNLLCDDNAGVVTKFIRLTIVDVSGAVNNQVDIDISGGTYNSTGIVNFCNDYSVEQILLCDDTLYDGTVVIEFMRHTVYDNNGDYVLSYSTELDMTTTYTVLGDVADCSNSVDNLVANRIVHSGIGMFTFPVNTKSISYFVAQVGDVDNLPQITTNAGVSTIYVGEAGNFETVNGIITNTVSIENFDADDIVILNYTTR